MSLSQSQKYIKTDPINHILSRPDMYVGTKKFKYITDYIWENNSLQKKQIEISPALLRIFVEILSNAIDNVIRSSNSNRKSTTIKVTITPKECSVFNDGLFIPIEMNEKEKIYNHSLIFGHLLSGSNYDDTEKRLTSGRNGLGAKLTNVFSKTFIVEGIDADNNKKLVQTWTNNMKKTDGPKVTKIVRVNGSTKITWEIDLAQFEITKLSKDMIGIYSRYVLDTAITTGINIYLNNEKLPNKLSKYIELIDPECKEILKLSNDNSNVIVTPNNEFEAISFVNGIRTKNGGKHVDAWVEAVCRPIIKKLKSSNLTLKDIKPNFRFIIISSVINPEFDSQEKNTLESPKLHVDYISSTHVSKILKWSIGEKLKHLSDKKELTKISKITTKKHINIEGYDKANNAGTKKSNECCLILCEGLSAKTFAVAGINHGLFDKKGRDWFGIYPLRGKLLNVRNATPAMISKNIIIMNMIKILGLDFSKPDNFKDLNYGKICIITDADVDGIHIEGLILNFIHTLFPKLLTNNFIISMKTPIVKVDRSFYFDERTYSKNIAILSKKAKIKYFKGLGSTKSEDVKNIFGMKLLNFVVDDDTNTAFEMAFNKTKSEERKKWLASYNPLDYNIKTLDDISEKISDYSITNHINNELVKFSFDDCKRSLPSLLDGLKESQRKILYAAKKRNLISELKVAQFGGYVAEHTNYHHGEQNLFETIIKLAQDFPGSNNLPLFTQEGQFGTRLEGGKDAASPRYICTHLKSYTESIFPSIDDNLLKTRIDDGDLVEPFHYIPIIPMILVNGCIGIGTGWLSNIPLFSVKDVIKNTKKWINKEKLLDMIPSYNNFLGKIEKIENNKYISKGKYIKIKNIINITELPIGLWNDKFKEWCNEQVEKKCLKYKDRSTVDTINFELTITSDFAMEKLDKILSSSLNLNNIVVFDENENIVKIDIFNLYNIWGNQRKILYEKRKQKKLEQLNEEIKKIQEKILFIKLVTEKKIILTHPEEKIIEIMKKNKLDNENLLSLSIRTLTIEKKKDLEIKYKALKNESEILFNTDIKNIWLDDITTLENKL